ncbi:MAG TPA: SirB2 family protein [Gammaproteobacteria bacterium]
MSFYSLIKIIHIICAILSISGFIIRGGLMMSHSLLLQHPVSKRLPHIIDSLLLATALIMIFMSSQYPFVLDWLTAKVIALLVYILLGMVALKWGKTRNIRIMAWVLAVLTFVYIVSVALSRSVLPFMG